MLRKFFFVVLCVFLFACASLAQTDNCVKGDFFTDYRQPTNAQKLELKTFEDKLCTEIKENTDLQAIYGFIYGSKSGEIVRVYKNKIVFTDYEGLVRYRERELSGAESENLRKEIAGINLETLPPQGNTCADMCRKFEFIGINRQGGRRVFIYRSDHPTKMDAIESFFERLNKSDNFRIHYYLQDQIKETKLLFADNRCLAQSFWKNGDDMRVLVADETINDWQKRFSWRKFSNGKLGEVVEQPKNTFFTRTKNENNCGRSMVVNRYPFQNSLGDSEICVGVSEKEGLWKVGKGEETKILSGIINYSFVTPDKKWIIYGKANKEWRNLYYLYRFNLATREEFKVNLPPADFVGAVYFVAAHNKVLIVRDQVETRTRENNPSPEKPLYYLIDLETGDVEQTEGEFAPLMQTEYRDLQPTGKPNEFWATLPDWKNRTHTLFGRYNTETFIFTPIIKFSGILFKSNDMWIDETEGKLYFVYDGHLLSMPLPR